MPSLAEVSRQKTAAIYLLRSGLRFRRFEQAAQFALCKEVGILNKEVTLQGIY